MNELLADYLLFAAKTGTVVAGLLVLLVTLALTRQRHRRPQALLRIRHLNAEYDQMRGAMEASLFGWRERRQRRRARKREHETRDVKARARAYVLDFDGDLQASAVEHLRREVTAILQIAQPGEEVVLRLESGGGLVHSYGLAASQLQRLREARLQLTVSVDRLAASGGYMMACVGERIIAAPFAILGSIGVVAQLPNFNRFLRQRDVDVELHTAGAYKRTLTVLGENTPEGRAKFQAELDETHQLFKAFVHEHRPTVDIEAVATGEHWYGAQALSRRLADEICTSDDYLLRLSAQRELYAVRAQLPQPLGRRLLHRARALGSHLHNWLARV